MKTILLICFFLVVNISFAQRFDGLYECQKDSSFSYIKFWPDGTLDIVSYSGKVSDDNLQQFFPYDNPRSNGIYIVETPMIYISNVPTFSSWPYMYIGKINGDNSKLDLTMYYHLSTIRKSTYIYSFRPFID